MKTNIFVPKKINVGFQNRKETYTGKLAYVIYFDEKGKLRKETSWNGWRDGTIPNEIYDNEPTSGFVLNKKVGGVEESWGWDPRKTYTRVYDPRGFEFEITIPNLLWILENCNCIKGKGLEGEFVYGWDGKELLLVPVDSTDYKEIAKKNEIFHNNGFIKAKELKVGATYIDKDDNIYTYMGKFEKYDKGCWINGLFFKTYKKMQKYCEENNIEEVEIHHDHWGHKIYEYDYKFDYGLVGKEHCFSYIYKDYQGNETVCFTWKSSISKWLIGVVNDKCHIDYAQWFETLEHRADYSPPDTSKATYHEESLSEFSERAGCYSVSFYSNVNGNIEEFKIEKADRQNSKYILYKYDSHIITKYNEVLNLFPTEEKEERMSSYYHTVTRKVTRMIPVTLEEIFNKMKPMYKQTYLANGKTYKKEY